MKKTKKLLSIMLSICLMFSVINIMIPIKVDAQTNFSQRISELRTKFPNGKYWNHKINSYHNNSGPYKTCTNSNCTDPDGYTSTPCTSHSSAVSGVGNYDCNNFDGAIQCCGFAKKIFYDVWGQHLSSGVNVTASFDNIKAGDFIKTYGSEGGDHYFFVLTKSSSSITTVEANVSGNCKIVWDRTRTKGSFTVREIIRTTKQDVAVSITSQPDKNTITDNNAILWARVDKPSNYAVTKIGIKVREDGSTYDKSWEKYEAPTQSYVGATYMEPYFNLNTELNANLKHATKYYCRFYAIINGKEYWSVEYYFTTTGSHAYNYKGFDATHPHRYYKKCACGDYYHLDEYKDYYSECVYCNTTYTIKYDANGGLNAPASQSKKYDKDITLSSQVPTRNGHKFLGCPTSKTATAKNYSSGQTYS